MIGGLFSSFLEMFWRMGGRKAMGQLSYKQIFVKCNIIVLNYRRPIIYEKETTPRI